MGIVPKIFLSKVMHKRLFPRINRFIYRVYYLCLPLSRLDDGAVPVPVDRWGIISFSKKDHGPRDGGALTKWAQDILLRYDVTQADGEIVLICMPRILGYVFNPISFWLCHDKQGALRAVICEVNNTFGETHSYLCVHDDQRVIEKNDWLTAQKLFHVSPFLKREGHYRFRFALAHMAAGEETTDSGESGGVWIDYYNADGERQLLTALTGRFFPLNRRVLRRVFFRYPLVTLKTIFLIHWQALKLLVKGMKYIAKPVQNAKRISKSRNLTEK